MATGRNVARHLQSRDGSELPKDRIQPNGVDIGIDTLYRVSGRAVFKGDDYDKPKRTRIQASTVPAPDVNRVYSIPPGSYIAVYDVEIEIPDGYVGHVYPRSRLMRCGLHLTTALWDQGYEGVGEGLLQVPRGVERATIPTDMPIAQMTFRPADKAETQYEGRHQRERLTVSGDD